MLAHFLIQNYLFIIGLTILCALPVVIAATLVFTFSSGKQPWNKKTYRVVGALQALIAILFAALLVINYLLIHTLDHWFALAIPAVFGALAYHNLRQAHRF